MVQPDESAWSQEQRDLIRRCESTIGYQFRDKQLLCEALTHASSADHRLNSNERLEFLGDSILGFMVCEHLFQIYPDWMEGDLTRIKSAAVSRTTCAKIAKQLELVQFLMLGKGMDADRAIPVSLLANALESIVGAIYLDGGLEAARRFIMPLVRMELEAIIAGEAQANYKSHLQQLAQRDYGEPPIYVLLDEKGPDHSKCFKISAQVGTQKYSPAWGRNKKEAEQRAAGNALAELDNQSPPYPAD